MSIIPVQGFDSRQTYNGKSIMNSEQIDVTSSIVIIGLYGTLYFNREYYYYKMTIDLKFTLLPITAEQIMAGKLTRP